MKHPDFILAGASRCGTTSLYETLLKHPSIIPPWPDIENSFRYEHGSIDLSQKEIRFFDRYWDKGTTWYYNRFKDVPGTITGDGSTMYLYQQIAMKRIQETLPDSKIILLLRNPINRLHSHFYHLCKINKEWAAQNPSFEEFVEKELASDSPHHMITRGFYHGVKHCLDLFDRSQILMIKSEDIFQDSDKVMSTLLSFLGVDDISLDYMHLRHANSIPMDEVIREKLRKFYEPYNRKLYKLVCRNFNW